MKCEPVKLVFRYFGLWLVLLVVVLLLTLLFNFFGTLSCAALAGVMLGATKHRRWLTLPVSLVFPGVVFALMYLSKVDLQGEKRIVVPALCFGIFWMTYLVVCFMAGFESKEAGSPVPSGVAQATPAQTEGVVANSVRLPETVERLRVDQLQGRWRFESEQRGSPAEKKFIEIVNGRVVLRVFDLDGRMCSHAEGELSLENTGDSKGIVGSPPDQPGDG